MVAVIGISHLARYDRLEQLIDGSACRFSKNGFPGDGPACRFGADIVGVFYDAV